MTREYLGEKEVGEVCAANSECKSEICVAGKSGVRRCTQTCCTPSDCAAYDWAQSCRPPFAGTDALSDTNATAIINSLGRQAISLNGVWQEPGIGSICMPK